MLLIGYTPWEWQLVQGRSAWTIGGGRDAAVPSFPGSRVHRDDGWSVLLRCWALARQDRASESKQVEGIDGFSELVNAVSRFVGTKSDESITVE